VQNLEETKEHLQQVDGVMIGRAAYSQPEMFAAADHQIFGEPEQAAPSEEHIIAVMNDYLQKELAKGARISWIAKHLVGLFKNRPNARKWRQGITHLIQEHPEKCDLVGLYQQVFRPSLVAS
jgi:tRNA-dihydrouridine synthase A